MPAGKALGANHWKTIAGRGARAASGFLKEMLACPDDDAPLEFRTLQGEFICPACARIFRYEGAALSLLAAEDPYRATAEQIEKLRREARDGSNAPVREGDPLWQKVMTAAAALDGKRVLDLCCGSGWAAARFAAMGASVAALDIVPPEEFGAVAPGFDSIQGDACRLPFAPESFDIVFISSAIHCMTRPERMMKEASRVLRGDGILLSIGEPMAHGGGSMGIGITDPRAEGRQLSPADYDAILSEAGLKGAAIFAGDDAPPPEGAIARFRRNRRDRRSSEPRLIVARRRREFGMPRFRLPWKRVAKS